MTQELLAGRRAVVVGGSRGIGRAVAHLLAELGAAVVVNGRRADAVHAVVDELSTAGHRATGFTGSPSDSDTATALIGHCTSTFGGLDAVVNCAGIPEPPGSSILTISVEEFQDQLDSHLMTVFHTCRAAAPVMVGMPAVLSSALATPIASAASVAGAIVFLDPGHNGANDASIYKQVPTGRGGTKDCQTSGTTTDAGFPEHTFNWDVVLRIRQQLSQIGVRTAMSRGDDSALGPCVDQRAAMANALRPNAIVSIHADGGPPSGHGFHVNYSTPALNAAQAGPAVRFAQVMRDQMAAAGMTPSTYMGNNGLYGRADLTGLNLAQYPSILVECGNMKNPQEGAAMATMQGWQTYANAICQGIAAFIQAS